MSVQNCALHISPAKFSDTFSCSCVFGNLSNNIEIYFEHNRICRLHYGAVSNKNWGQGLQKELLRMEDRIIKLEVKFDVSVSKVEQGEKQFNFTSIKTI